MASTKEELLDQWVVATDPTVREDLVQQMMVKGLFPDDTDYEEEYGLYPALEDDNFIKKLFKKREFGENQTDSIEKQLDAIENGEANPCDTVVEFEVTPLQRFVKNFLSGKTPYNSALLYHGVGVGKTCSAIGIAESNLFIKPRKKVFIIAPPNIQPNFERTIFDINNVIISKEADIPNTHIGCTGNLYLQLTNTEYEKDKRIIDRKVKQLVKTRYEIMGYYQLYSYIKRIMDSIPPIDDLRERDLRINKKLNKAFSGHCMIIDEAHNLRDSSSNEEDENFDETDENELSNKAQGKKLTPVLSKVLKQSFSMKLILLTATPMYNKYSEILFLLNLLLENDKRPLLKETRIFNNNEFRESGKIDFIKIVKNYVSYMRGETPITFPIRLKPFEGNRLKRWFPNSPNKELIKLTDQQLKGLLELPLIPVTYYNESDTKPYEDFKDIFEESINTNQLSLSSVDTMIQSGNWIYPSIDKDASLTDRIRDTGFDNCFDSGAQFSSKNIMRFKSKLESASWLLEDELPKYSPKAAFIIKNIRKTEGAIFIYSRFIKSGALPLALALEANGYTPYGRDRTLLVDGIQDGQGRQCAKCSLREKQHTADHKFIPAKYILLTGNKSLSPKNNEMIEAERARTNYDGGEIKIVIGSEVASEGIDLRYIREIYVFDSWYHLNRMEQVLGRGIRTCSHYLLPPEKRNCTVYLLVNILENDTRESADLYMYRKAMLKSQQIGNVTRVIKEHALDCNLNIGVNIIRGLDEKEEIDSQGNKRLISFNDQDFTNMCDWMECEYTCAEPIDIDPEELDNLTYDDYTAQWRESQVKSKIRELFQKNFMMIRAQDITEIFSAIPSEALFSILHDIVNNKSFRLKVNNKEGYITYRNGYYLFQPLKLKDLEIPLSIRSAEYPVKQDNFRPIKEELTIVKDDDVQKEEVISESTNFWPTITDWCSKIQDGEADTNVLPKSIIAALHKKFKHHFAIADEIKDKLEMIIWLYKRMKDVEEYRSILSYVCLEFVWDYCLTFTEQISLAKEQTDIIKVVAKENIMKDNTYRYMLLNEPYNMMYWCNDKLCSEIIIKVLEKDINDSYNSLKANVETTGPIYGFLVPKKGTISFKLIDGLKTRVAEVGQSPPSGAVCSDIQTVDPKLKMLYKFGSLLREAGLPDFDLNEPVFNAIKEQKAKKGKKEKENILFPRNPNTYCALEEFVLRWMDIKKVNGKRWFYRPIAAYKSGHRGKMIKAKVVKEKIFKEKIFKENVTKVVKEKTKSTKATKVTKVNL